MASAGELPTGQYADAASPRHLSCQCLDGRGAPGLIGSRELVSRACRVTRGRRMATSVSKARSRGLRQREVSALLARLVLRGRHGEKFGAHRIAELENL